MVTVNTNLSVIHQPDSPGVSCLFTPFSFYLGGYRTYAGLPNNQDYNLGPFVGSGCDTLSITSNTIAMPGAKINAFMHHVWQTIFVNVEKLKGNQITISVYDGQGKLMYQAQNVQAQGGYLNHNIVATTWPNGLYLIELKTDKEKLSCKVVKH